MAAGRRAFLERLALGAAGAGGLLAVDPREFAAQGPAAGRWDLSWVKRLAGRPRAIFDVLAIEDGFGVWRAAIWRKQYSSVFGVPESSLSTVINLRHDAIELGLNQEYWSRYSVGRRRNVRDPVTRQPTTRNPVYGRNGPLADEYADFALERLIEAGVIVLGCALALRDSAALVSEQEKITLEAAEQRVRGWLIPGVVLQPSGVFAAVLAQDNGCRYVRAS